MEAALQGGVAFDVFAVFIERGGANNLQFAARQRGFENIGGVYGGACGAGAHQHVGFVDKEDGIGGLEFVDDFLEALFKLAAVHRAGD